MADIQDTDLFLVNRNNSTGTFPASELMAEILDDDLMLVNRGGQTYKVTGLEVKDSLGPKEEPPSMTGATLAGTGASFSGQTYTTTLQNYNPGVPEADQTMVAKLTGALSVVGETSAITNVNTRITPIYSNFLTTSTTWSGDYTPDKAFNGVLDGAGGAATDGTADLRYTHPEIITVTKLEMRSYSGLDVTLPDGSTTTCPGIGAEPIWSEIEIPNGSFDFDGTNYIGMSKSGGTSYLDGFKLNGVELIDSQSRTDLALTDRKDLDNGLFQPGDAVDGHGGLSYTVVSTPSNASDYIYDPKNIFDGDDSSYAAWYMSTQGGTLNITFTEQVVASSIRIKTFLTGADFTVNLNGIGLPIDLTSSSETWNDITNGFTGPLTSLLVTMTSTGTGQNWFYAIEVDGTILTAEEVAVVSINPTTPEMTVSGGSWSVGETVKNTVARAPEITPTTDEIVGLGSTLIGSQVGIYASSNLDTAPSFSSYLDKGDTTTSWATTWPSVTYTQTGGTGGTIGFWYSDDAVTWTRDSSTVWGTSPLGGGGTGVDAKRYMAFNADVTGAADGADVGYVAIPDMTGLTVVLTQGIPVLTFAGDKDLVQFSANDDVEQDSGYQPITSAITNVATDSFSKVKAYYSAVAPTNLAEAKTGVEYDLTKSNTNTVENSHYLTLVCEDGCPTSGQVFKTNEGPIFNMKYNTESGNFDKDGNRLDAADNPPSGPSDTTQIFFSDGGTTGHIVNIRAAYTVISTTNLGSVPVVVDAAQGEQSVLTLTNDKDLANFRVGDAISIPDTTPQTADVKFALTSPYQDNGDYYLRSGYTDNGGGESAPLGTYTDIISVTDAGVLELNARAYGNVGPVTIELVNGTTDDPLTYSGASSEQICPSTVTFGAGGGSMKITWNKTQNLSDHVIYYLYFSGQANSTWQGGVIAGGKTYEAVAAVTGAVLAIGPGNTLTLDKPGFSNGETVTGPATTPATGTVASTDPVAKTMTLATSDESGSKRWIVNAGKTVVGPTGPAQRFDAYLTWSGKQVTGLSTIDPGYAQAPTDLQLQFTDPAPSGQTWDQELPAGTTIQTRVKATNDSGEADSGWSNVVTPRFLRPSDALPETFAETSLRMATFENRAAVYQGELAMEKREDLAKELESKGINANELLGIKAKRGRRKPAS